MADREFAGPAPLALDEAARYLGVSPHAVGALVDAGYLAQSEDADDEMAFRLGDLKSFMARNAGNGSGNLLGPGPEAADPEELLAALDGRSEEMARRAMDIFSAAFPESRAWTLYEQGRFVEQAKARFEAILAVTGQGTQVDEALVEDLEQVGANAAWTGTSLPQLLVVLRISRDLVVQTAVELAEERGRHWGMALSLLLTRVLPAMDRLTDAIARGYWTAVLGKEEENRSRYENVVEHAANGVWEIDLDGRVHYANPALAIILGRPIGQIEGQLLQDVLTPLDGNDGLFAQLSPPEQPYGPDSPPPQVLAIARADGVRRVLEVHVLARRRDGDLVGWQGIVLDTTTAHDLEADKNEFLALVTRELRQPLSIITGLGATLESHGQELGAEHIARVGASVRRQAERISRLADDLYDVSRLDASDLLLATRPVELAALVGTALDGVAGDATTPGDGDPPVTIRVPPGTVVQADPRRLEQVLANLIENAVIHGAAPVAVEARPLPSGGAVEVAVTDSGTGVAAADVPTLFSRVRTLARAGRDRSRGTGLGLSLVRRLVEAMGGRAWYEPAPGGGACFKITLPAPRERLASMGRTGL